jgi:NMD protein affecting ribosome stability and mRNA decay
MGDDVNKNICVICGKSENCLFEAPRYVCNDCYRLESLRQEYEDLGTAVNNEIFDRDGE